MHTTNSLISFLLLTATFLASKIPSTSANPLPRALSIPPAPADPPKPADGDGIGPYNSQDAGIRDRLAKAKFYTVAVAAGELGLVNAERGMRHYLGNSGDDLNVTPESMMSGLSKFRESVKALAQNEAAAAYKSISGASGEKAFRSSWKNFTPPRIRAGIASGGGSLKYRVHVFDRYNWDAGKSVDIGPFHFEDTELGNLHLKGLARSIRFVGRAR
ncbi:hypothetical protein H2199_005473 [Coniosporium tulheliwenetii]|uniref:Uncharacterized protein n=1 Tax=Coniosporium tulheliwenetii TaxID=3383036 RepID=A0ACC2Z2N7_9PEZI|nr:hypothetical protein H2199_005473 [Cladosporium sp. JES 115]